MVTINQFQIRLKKARKHRNMTQTELAKKAYLSKNIISNIERGVTEKVTDNELAFIAYALRVDIKYLKGEIDDFHRDKNGVISPVVFIPKMDLEEELKKVLKIHCNDNNSSEVEGILRDYLFFLREEVTPKKGYEPDDINLVILRTILDFLRSDVSEKNDKMRALSKISCFLESTNKKNIGLLNKFIEYLNYNPKSSDIDMLNDFLDILINRSKK